MAVVRGRRALAASARVVAADSDEDARARALVWRKYASGPDDMT